MDVSKLLAELRAERALLDEVITNLEQIPPLEQAISGLQGLLVLDIRIDGDVRPEWDVRMQERLHRALAGAQ